MGGHKLIFAGRLVEGQDRADAVGRLAALFHQDRAWAEQRLFGGQAIVIKSVDDPAMAARYVAAFRRAGAILEVDPPLPESIAATLEEPQTPASQDSDSGTPPAAVETPGPASGASSEPGHDTTSADESMDEPSPPHQADDVKPEDNGQSVDADQYDGQESAEDWLPEDESERTAGQGEQQHSAAETGAHPDADGEAEARGEPELQAEAAGDEFESAGPESAIEPESEPAHAPDLESKPEPEPGSEAEPEAESEPESELEPEPEPELEALSTAAEQEDERPTQEIPVVDDPTPGPADDESWQSKEPATEEIPSPITESSSADESVPELAPAAAEKDRHWGVPLAIGLLVVVSLVTGGWWYWKNQVQSVVPQSVLRIEDALSTDSVIAMGVLDVAAAVQVEKALVEEPASGLPVESPVLDLLQAAGTDLRRDIRYLMFALDPAEEDSGRYAMALTGRFDPDRIRDAMATRFDIRSDGESLVVRYEDPMTCEWSREWAVDLADDRILITTPEAMPALQERLTAGGVSPARDLAGWRTARSGQLMSLALFRPAEIHRAADGMAGMMLSGAGEQMQPVDAMFLGLSLQPLPPSGRLDVEVVSGDAEFTGQVVNQANESLTEARQQLGSMGVAAQNLLQGITVAQAPTGIHGSLTIDASLAENLQQAISDVVGGFLGGGMMLGDGSPTEEQIDESPTVFLTEYDPGSIPAFGSIDDANFQADATGGPFAVRVVRLAIDEAGSLAVELAAEGRQIRNLGDDTDRAHMRVISVRSADGRELLKRETCGVDRNDQPLPLQHQIDGSTFSEDGELLEYTKINGQKAYRLIGGVRPEDVVLVDIEFRVDLPVRTETRVLAMPLGGQSMTVDETTLQFKQAGPSEVSYEIIGDPSPILAIRALNADQQHLADGGGMSGDRMFGEGRTATRQYYGEVAFAEVVVATESRPLRYPVTLERILPAFPESSDPRAPAELQPVDPDAFDAEFANAGPPSVPEDARGWFEPDATAQAGPFELELSGLQAGGFWGIFSNFTLRGPLVNALQNNLGGVRLALDEAMTPDGAEPLSHVSPVALARPGGYYMNGEYQADPDRAYLEGQGSFQIESELETVTGLSGRVLVTMPTGIERIDFEGLSLGEALNASGLGLVPISLSADRLDVRVEGDAATLVAFELYDAEGRLISGNGQSLAGSVASVPFVGHPERLSVILAGATADREYPFRLEWPATE